MRLVTRGLQIPAVCFHSPVNFLDHTQHKGLAVAVFGVLLCKLWGLIMSPDPLPFTSNTQNKRENENLLLITAFHCWNSQLWPGKRHRFICVYFGFWIRLLCSQITCLNANCFWLIDKLHELSKVLNYTRAEFKESAYSYFMWLLNSSGKVQRSSKYRTRPVLFFPECLFFMQFYCMCRELGDTGSLLLPCAVLPSPGLWYFT